MKKNSFFILVIIVGVTLSCKRIFHTQTIKGSIKDMRTGNPIKNQAFKMDYSTTKTIEYYNSKTDANGNFKLKNVVNTDNATYHFSFDNFHYIASDFNQWFDFYVNEGQLISDCNLNVKFSLPTNQNDTLLLKFGGYGYFKGISKTLIGPFTSRLSIPISDRAENYCSHKNDGIEEHEITWQFRGKSGTINLTDNYLTGVGTIDSLSF